MAKKRKQTSDSTPNKLPKPSQPSSVDEEFEEVEEEVEEEIEVEEEVEEEIEVEEDDDMEENAADNDQVDEGGDGDDGDDEPISKLLEPFTKDQLMTLLSKAAESHADVVESIRKMADLDPVHRKIFVHGLGWEATTDMLRSTFEEYGEIEDCKSVTDKVSGKSKGYGFILFKKRAGARNALKEPQKKIGGRMTACQLAAVGPGPGPGPGGKEDVGAGASEYTQRKIYVSNVGADLDPSKVTELFAKYGEIEEGPLGLDKQTGKFKGFCLFVYKNAESVKKALEEPHKNFDGLVLHCQKAIDGPKQGKLQHKNNQHFGGRGGRGGRGNGSGNGQGVSGVGVPFNQGGGLVTPGLNPALGQALSALLTPQGVGLGLNNLFGAIGGGGIGQVGYGSQGVGGSGIGGPSGVLGYGTNPGGGLQGAYPNQLSGGQGGSGRSKYGHMGGGAAPYGGH